MQGQSIVQYRDDGLVIERIPFRDLAARVREKGGNFFVQDDPDPVSARRIAWAEEENLVVEVVWDGEDPYRGPRGPEWGFFIDGGFRWTIAGGEDPRP